MDFNEKMAVLSRKKLEHIKFSAQNAYFSLNIFSEIVPLPVGLGDRRSPRSSPAFSLMGLNWLTEVAPASPESRAWRARVEGSSLRRRENCLLNGELSLSLPRPRKLA